ncbi:MAG: tetratricopeptide repeat protein [Candidatus Azobacteroides sp.]|nr:tetratricopeptide repeat protein [Candidatus Azobacteroides sp.]
MKYCFLLFFLLLTSVINAQKEERRNIREGNKLYENQKYKEAEDLYNKALSVNSKSVEGFYNSGNAIYRQLKPGENKAVSDDDKKKMNEALNQYKTVTSLSQDKKQKAMAWHNMGNLFMLTGDYQQSVDAYKNALLNNPDDNETRYNYVLAKELLKKQQQQQDQQQNKDKDKDKNKDQNQDKNKDQQQQNNDQDKKDKDKDQNQNQQQDQNQMSKDNAQQILDAMMQDEKQTQEKLQQAKKVQAKKQPDKDW